MREASDERNSVKKAVNWALRQIGKRNMVLNAGAIKTCTEIRDSDSKSAKWIAPMLFVNSQAILSGGNLALRSHTGPGDNIVPDIDPTVGESCRKSRSSFGPRVLPC